MAFSLGNLVDVIVLISVIAMDIYGFYVLRKAQKEIDGVSSTRTTIDEKINFITESYTELQNNISDVVAQAQEMLNPGVAVEMGEAIVLNSLQSLGMSNLKELGAKGRTISNAKIGLQIVGNEIAKGAGVNELLEQFSPQIEKLQQGQGMLDAFSDNPLLQLMGGLMGGSGGGTRSQQQSNITRELKK